MEKDFWRRITRDEIIIDYNTKAVNVDAYQGRDNNSDTAGKVACSAGVFFERAISLRKRHVQTSRREEEMGRVKGSGEGAGRAGRKKLGR